MWQTVWKAFSGPYGGRWAGGLSGLMLAILYLIVGFWDMLIFAFIVFVGYYIGSMMDQKQKLERWRELAQWLTQRWKG